MNTPAHFDVLIVGAGISGIGAAAHLQDRCPGRTFALLEGRENLGGTWDLFRYPGVRSDSDMYTLGYGFKPWTGEAAIADGASILRYLEETVEERGIRRHIRFQHQVQRAEWSTDDARWTVRGVHSEEPFEVTGTFLFMCAGYYSYRGGYQPSFPGSDRFRGRVIHPQEWPRDLDYADKRVVVIGSGATAMTLVPAMTDKAEHVTMLQRSPTYVVSRPAVDRIAKVLRKVLPEDLAYRITRRKNVALQRWFYNLTRRKPEKTKKKLLELVQEALGPEYDVATHFTPTYRPWDQRLCLVPDGDLFNAIRAQKASVVTDQIESFTEEGIQLVSGEELEADIIVTATGLRVVTLGEADFTVDGAPIDFSKTWTYRGFAYCDVPNLASSFGYVRASWTLRVDLICEFVCRILNHMEATGTQRCTPRLRPTDQGMEMRDWLPDFSAGYIQRAMHLLPKQGDREPWIASQDYLAERRMLRSAPVDDGVLRFS